MPTSKVLFHFLGALRRAISRVLLWFFGVLIVSIVVVEAVGYFAANHPAQYRPAPLTNVAAAVIGLSLAYSVAVTILIGEVISFAIQSVEGFEHEAKQELGSVEQLAESVVQDFEHKEPHR